MDKVLYFNELYACYAELLTKKEQEIFTLYYEENLSMGEISDIKKISRSGVGATVKNVEAKLINYEKLLHKSEIKKELNEIKRCNSLLEVNTRIDNILNNL